MNQQLLESNLADLNLSAVRYFQRIGSTNDESSKWIDSGAPNLALVIADEQTSGRGRSKRRWITTPGSCLAFSLILLSPPLEPQHISRLSGLGGVAVCEALQKKYGLSAQIKWPNDILLNNMKAGGVLVEAQWTDSILKAVIIGIGINIALESVSVVNLPPTELNFPATCIEDVLEHPVNRLELLHAILHELLSWLPRLSSPEFIRKWEDGLAFRDQWVELSAGDITQLPTSSNILTSPELGKVIGLNKDGTMRFVTRNGELLAVTLGEIHLRPVTQDQSYPLLD